MRPTAKRFGEFVLDPGMGQLRRSGQLVALQDLPLRLLAVLVERAPEVVSRVELREALWPPGAHLDVDASLNTAVARVREALGDEASAPRFVATVPRRGYRFLAPVEGLESVRSGPGGRGWRPLVAGLAAAVVVVSLIGFGWWQRGRDFVSTSESPSSIAGGLESGDARAQLRVARHQLDRRTRGSLEKAIAAFQLAAADDPSSAEAYSGLAMSYALLGIYDFWRPTTAFEPAERMAQRALDLDPASAEAHLAMGLVAGLSRWDWTRAEDEIGRAVSLAPEEAVVWYWQGAAFAVRGSLSEAVECNVRAVSIDPTSALFRTALGWRLFQAGQGEEAVAALHEAIDLDPGYFDAWDNLKWIQLTRGQEAEAVEAWARAEEIDTGRGEAIRRLYRESGVEGLHRASLAAAVQRAENPSVPYQSPYDIVLELVALGELDQAMSWLERSRAERETDLVGLAIDPRIAPLRGRKRFGELVAEIGVYSPGGDR